jgi:anaerobic sulfite reductase subunit C
MEELRKKSMEWDQEAREAVERAPFFVRRFVRGKVEEYVRASGEARVTLAAVNACRSGFLASRDKPSGATPSSSTDTSNMPAVQQQASLASLSEEDIKAIERLTEQTTGLATRYLAVQNCGGAVGCPLTLADVSAFGEKVGHIVATSGVSEHLAAAIKGPVLAHYRFRAALAGCPNCCSEPQIKDFSFVAKAKPGVGPGACSQCGQCVEACKEGALTLCDEVIIDYGRCLDCGRCVEACTSEALSVVKRGYDVLVGGKLGRHPALARRILRMGTEEEALAALRAALQYYIANSNGPERPGALIDRVGYEAFLSWVLNTGARNRP